MRHPIIQRIATSVKTLFVKNSQVSPEFWVRVEKRVSLGESPAILRRDGTMGVVGWFQVFFVV